MSGGLSDHGTSELSHFSSFSASGNFQGTSNRNLNSTPSQQISSRKNSEIYRPILDLAELTQLQHNRPTAPDAGLGLKFFIRVPVPIAYRYFDI